MVDAPGVGSVIMCKPGTTPDAVLTFDGAGVTIMSIQIDGMDQPVAAIKGSGFQHRIDDCDIRRGSAYGIHITEHVNGHENKIIDTNVTMNSMGVGVRYAGSATGPSHDNVIDNLTVRGAPRYLELIRSSGIQVVGCQLYSYPAITTDCLVYIDNGTINSSARVTSTACAVPLSKCTPTGAIDQTQFVGCMVPSFVGELADNTVPGIEVKHNTYGGTNTVFTSNTVAGANATRRYSFVISAVDGGGDPRGLVLVGNNCPTS